jgi:vitamin B12 transporter
MFKCAFVQPSMAALFVGAVSIGLAVQPVQAYAQPGPDQAVTTQSPVEVTATRAAQTVDAALSDVTVITRADIDLSGAADLTDLLRGIAGVDIVRSGGPGAQTSLFLRGTNSNQVLVLVDGVRAASVGTAAVDWSQFPLDAIQRIEIVRGPRAAYWGSDAIGGVIQIFTRKLQSPELAVQYGSYADASGSAGIGDWGQRGGFSVLAGLRHVTGFPDTTPDNFPYSPANDGYRGKNVAARGAYRLGAQTLSGTLNRNDADVEFAGGTTHTINQTLGIDLDGNIADGWSEHVGLGENRGDLLTAAYDSLFKSRRQSLTWQNTLELGARQALIAGFDYVREHGTSSDASGLVPVYDATRNNEGLFAGWNGHSGRLDWELAARHDHNSQFGNATTASVAAGWQFDPHWRVSANVGQGFRAPDLDELYSPGYSGFFAGNPTLGPERSRTGEVAVDWTPSAAWRLKLAGYHTAIDDLIEFTGPMDRAENVARARIDGAELVASWRSGGWRVSGNATWQDPRNADSGQTLLRRATRKADLTLSRAVGKRVEAGLRLYAQGPTEDIGGPLGGFALVDATLGVALAHDLTLRLRAANLADRDYTLARGYATAGRSGWIELVWRPRHP